MDKCSNIAPVNIPTKCNFNHDAPKVEPPYDSYTIHVTWEPNRNNDFPSHYMCIELPIQQLYDLSFTLPLKWLSEIAGKVLFKWNLPNVKMIEMMGFEMDNWLGVEIAKYLPPFEFTIRHTTHRYDRFEFLRVDERGVYTFKLLHKQ